jgi:hypothetical protein
MKISTVEEDYTCLQSFGIGPTLHFPTNYILSMSRRGPPERLERGWPLLTVENEVNGEMGTQRVQMKRVLP